MSLINPYTLSGLLLQPHWAVSVPWRSLACSCFRTFASHVPFARCAFTSLKSLVCLGNLFQMPAFLSGIPHLSSTLFFFYAKHLTIFLFWNFIYLFIFTCAQCSLPHRLFSSCGKWGLLFSWGAWAFHCDGFSYCGTWAVGHMVFHSCSTCGQ